MPHAKSAMKRLRQNRGRHLRNKSTRSFLHTLKKKFLKACEDNKAEEAERLFRDVSSAFQKGAKRGIIHRNNASRNISRLNLRLLRLKKSEKK